MLRASIFPIVSMECLFDPCFCGATPFGSNAFYLAYGQMSHADGCYSNLHIVSAKAHKMGRLVISPYVNFYGVLLSTCYSHVHLAMTRS